MDVWARFAASSGPQIHRQTHDSEANLEGAMLGGSQGSASGVKSVSSQQNASMLYVAELKL